ncbi:hypothetical protein M0805_004485 [Coniferiporia weirii]|nr:hypothetical protein M0805_004485 [Coniferiporia weirii]
MGTTPDSASDPVALARALIARKDALEADLAAQYAALAAHSATMATPLVDPAGFPRADIDIVSVRAARVRVLEIKNDLTDVLAQIARALESVHAAAAVAGEGEPAPPASTRTPDADLRPFARVDGIAPGSPAASAGLQREDLFVQFGRLTSPSFPPGSQNPLAPLSALVAEYENRPLEIKIRRSTDTDTAPARLLTFSLTPRKGWGGRGLLGCHIVPFSQAHQG